MKDSFQKCRGDEHMGISHVIQRLDRIKEKLPGNDNLSTADAGKHLAKSSTLHD